MIEKSIDDYIDQLMINQNNGMQAEQINLFSRSDYYKLLKPVVDLINKDLSIEEIREQLYKDSLIEESINDFVYKKQMAPGMVFSFGTLNHKETIIIGNRSEVELDKNGCIIPSIKEMSNDTIFDLASVSKIFTSLSILKLVEDNQINLNDNITKYEPRFVNLNGVSIFDLISFKVPLKTSKRIDEIDDYNNAQEVVFSMSVNEDFKYGTNPYSDMQAMVLKYVIESASGMSYYDYINKNILEPLKLNDTYFDVPKFKIDKVAKNNFETQIMKDGRIINFTTNGEISDSKARILSHGNIESGHAGIFSSTDDMSNLAKSIIEGKLLSKQSLEMMAKNRTGEVNKEDSSKYIQYLGFLCYSKNPILANSELYHALSGKSFASSGWTGTQLSVDPVNDVFLFLASNRTHNRVSRNLNQDLEKVEDEFGKKEIILPNGERKIDSSRFAWDRDPAVVHPALKLAIQYKMTEDMYSLLNEKVTSNETIRKY